MDELKALLARREVLYAESRLKIRTTGKSPEAVVARIIKAVPAKNI
jgi:shikimate kinase